MVGSCRAAGPGPDPARGARAASPRLRCRARGSGARAGAPARAPPGAAQHGRRSSGCKANPAQALESCAGLRGQRRGAGRSRLRRQRSRLAGRARDGYRLLQDARRRSPGAEPILQVWAQTDSRRDSRSSWAIVAAAERHFRDALPSRGAIRICSAPMPISCSTRIGRVRSSRCSRTRPGSTRCCCGWLSPSSGSATGRATQHLALLQDRFDAARRRGDSVHLREEARFSLELLRRPGGGARARAPNWATQREPADARILLEAALAAQPARRPPQPVLALARAHRPRARRGSSAGRSGLRRRRMMARLPPAGSGAAGAAAGVGGRAHKPSDSYLSLVIDGSRSTGRWDIALRDLEHAIGLDARRRRRDHLGRTRRRRHDAIAAYALARLELAADGAPCPTAAGRAAGRRSIATAPTRCCASPAIVPLRSARWMSATALCSTSTRCTAAWSRSSSQATTQTACFSPEQPSFTVRTGGPANLGAVR